MSKDKPKGLDPAVREAIGFTIKLKERLDKIYQSFEIALERHEGLGVWKQFKDVDEAIAHYAKFLYDHFGQDLQSKAEEQTPEKEWVVEYSVPSFNHPLTDTIKAPTEAHARTLWLRKAPIGALAHGIQEIPNDSGAMPTGTEPSGMDATPGMVVELADTDTKEQKTGKPQGAVEPGSGNSN